LCSENFSYIKKLIFFATSISLTTHISKRAAKDEMEKDYRSSLSLTPLQQYTIHVHNNTIIFFYFCWKIGEEKFIRAASQVILQNKMGRK
jgi:hypothetical protein